MPKELSKIICPVCKKMGGSLTMRRAGNARNVKYFYIKHFNPSAKHKNTSCYIGLAYKLANVKLNDSRYRTYEKIVKSAYDYDYAQGQYLLEIKAEGLLRSLEFPTRYLKHKFIADTNKAFLEIEYEKHKKKGILQDIRYELFDRRLNWRVEEAIGRKVRYSERRLG